MFEGEIYRIWKLGAIQDDFKVNQKRIVLLRKIRSNVERTRFLGKDEVVGRLRMRKIQVELFRTLGGQNLRDKIVQWQQMKLLKEAFENRPWTGCLGVTQKANDVVGQQIGMLARKSRGSKQSKGCKQKIKKRPLTMVTWKRYILWENIEFMGSRKSVFQTALLRYNSLAV